MFLVRASALAISVLLAAEQVEPQWQWFAAIALLTAVSLRDGAGLALIILSSLLAFETLKPELPWLAGLSILAGAALLRNVEPLAPGLRSWSRRSERQRLRRFAIRGSVLVIAILLAAQVIEPRWEWFGVIALLGLLSLGDEAGVLLVVLASLLAFETIDPEQAWLVVLAVLAAWSVLRSLGRWYSLWQEPAADDPAEEVLGGLRTQPGLRRRLRQWAHSRDY